MSNSTPHEERPPFADNIAADPNAEHIAELESWHLRKLHSSFPHELKTIAHSNSVVHAAVNKAAREGLSYMRMLEEIVEMLHAQYKDVSAILSDGIRKQSPVIHVECRHPEECTMNRAQYRTPQVTAVGDK